VLHGPTEPESALSPRSQSRFLVIQWRIEVVGIYPRGMRLNGVIKQMD
jgi:hypothetical protein